MDRVNISLKQNKEDKSFSIGLFLFVFESFFKACFLISIFLLNLLTLMNKDFKENKESKELENKILAKNKIIEFCTNCQSPNLYEVFANKMFRCFKCNQTIRL